MTALERLDAAKLALDEAKAVYDAALAEVEALARETGATQFKGDHITVSVCTRRSVDAPSFVEWCLVHHPEQIEHAVRPAYRRAFLDGLRFENGDAIADGGEVIDWADCTSYLSVRSR